MNGAPEAMLLEHAACAAPTAPRARSQAGVMQSAAAELEDGAELLLWALAGDGVEDQALTLGQAEAQPYARVRQLRRLGAMLGREELAVLLRARLAEQLLKAGSAAELAALLRVFDKIPERAELQAQQVTVADGANNHPDGFEITGLDLATAVAEAQRLLAEIEDETNGVEASCGSVNRRPRQRSSQAAADRLRVAVLPAADAAPDADAADGDGEDE